MTDTLDPLVLDLVEWIAKASRTHRDVMDTWRTSCPRLTVWEEAVDRGYVARSWDVRRGALVTLTERGAALLQSNGRALPPPD